MRADIFCRVVDNYGDIGVLAPGPPAGPGSGLAAAPVGRRPAGLRPHPARLDPEQARQQCLGIDIIHWTPAPPADLTPGDVVIEAFACDPPDAFLDAMRQSIRSGSTWNT